MSLSPPLLPIPPQPFTKNPINLHKLQNKITSEEYKIWKKTVPLLYETIRVSVKESPSSIFRFLPGSQEARFITTAGSRLQICGANLPATLSGAPGPVEISKDHSFHVIAEHTMPAPLAHARVQNEAVAFFADKDAYVWGNNTVSSPLGHEQSGTDLAWSYDRLLTSAGSVHLWDLHALRKISQWDTLKSVAWNNKHPHIFASGTLDGHLKIYDARDGACGYDIGAHSRPVNSVAFHPYLGTVVASGLDDKLASLWDLRYFARPFRSFFGMVGEVQQVLFDPNQGNMMSTVTGDKRVYMWDLNEIDAGDFDEEIYGREPDNEDPCLRFIHGGHTERINDVDVSSDFFGVYGSVGEDRLVELWKPHFVVSEEAEDEGDTGAEDEKQGKKKKSDAEEKEKKDNEDPISETDENSKEDTGNQEENGNQEQGDKEEHAEDENKMIEEDQKTETEMDIDDAPKQEGDDI